MGVERKGRGGFLILGYQKSFSPLYLSSQLVAIEQLLARSISTTRSCGDLVRGLNDFRYPSMRKPPHQIFATL
jgi:hypothetical protein